LDFDKADFDGGLRIFGMRPAGNQVEAAALDFFLNAAPIAGVQIAETAKGIISTESSSPV